MQKNNPQRPHRKEDKKKIKIIGWVLIGWLLMMKAHASVLVPWGQDNSRLTYQLGGGSDFHLPPTTGNDTLNLDVGSELDLGYNCTAFNPALSIQNSLNDLKNSANNMTQDIITNATGSLMLLPMYLLAKINPTLYALLNNELLSAHHQLQVSTQSCEAVKEKISRGENPYTDWATIAVDNQWKRHLSLTASNQTDINEAKREIDAHSGDDGVPWTEGKKTAEGTPHAGGEGQPPIQVIADSVKAGYNTLLHRDLKSTQPAPSESELHRTFLRPEEAVQWITDVVGDQTIMTCQDATCAGQQKNIVGTGLSPRLLDCTRDKDNCVETLRDKLTALFEQKTPLSPEALQGLTAGGIVLTPDVIVAIQTLDPVQQQIVTHKLADEIAVQRLIDKALLARMILATGKQVPVIAANPPAVKRIQAAIQQLESDMQSLAFESQLRKTMLASTLSDIMTYAAKQQQAAFTASPAPAEPLLQHGARLSSQLSKS